MNNDIMINMLKELFEEVDKTILILASIDDESSKQMIKNEVFMYLDTLSKEFDKFLLNHVEHSLKYKAVQLRDSKHKIKLMQTEDCIAFINHHLEIPHLDAEQTEIKLNEKLLERFLSSSTQVDVLDFGENGLDRRVSEIYKNFRAIFTTITVSVKKLYEDAIDKETSVNEEFGMHVRQYLIFVFQEYYAFYISIKALCENIIID